MKICGIVLCVAGLCAGVVPAEELATERADDAKPKVGVYDSRAIAVAFVGSPAYESSEGKKLTALVAEQAKARAEGDQKRAAELEARGKAQQALLHRQGFSTAPVDNILKQIKAQMPGIARAAGVGAIVSKWDKAALAHYPSVELLDVTRAMVKAFHPTEKQLKAAIEIQKHEPIPLEQAEKIDD